MKLFRKNRKAGNPRQEAIAEGIAAGIIRYQRQLAAYLNRRAQHLSLKTRLILLILFCLLFAAINLYLLIHSI